MSVVSAFLMFLGKVVIALATTGFAGIFIHAYYKDDISSPVLPMVLVRRQTATWSNHSGRERGEPVAIDTHDVCASLLLLSALYVCC
jgi:hypothetical protein